MTGIEKLRDLESLSEHMAEWRATVTVDGEPLCDVLHRIAGQIEREQDALVKDSPYDALPPDEREDIAWVRDRGGLEAVKSRLMPEGMEWPRFEGGELVRVGDEAPFGADGTMTVTGVELTDDGHFILHGRDGGIDRPCQTGYQCGQRVKRPAPKVLDADGVEIEVGDDLYSVEGGLKLHVGCIDTRNGRIATAEMYAIDKWADPAMYTHRAPVIAADGRPLREGETVWSVDSGTRYTVEKITDELIPIKCCSEMGSTVSLHPSQLTHERPDSWERIEADCMQDAKDYCKERGIVPEYPKHSGKAKCEDLVRRAKKLAERDAK